jgi:hypothetical protein
MSHEQATEPSFAKYGYHSFFREDEFIVKFVTLCQKPDTNGSLSSLLLRHHISRITLTIENDQRRP